ncbi:MAG: hypothetical protein HYT37_02985 [Candidatus Sungbacteria bacterium]|nr:hypothetical protein [Candidatus Sungbacteria bacterium]
MSSLKILFAVRSTNNFHHVKSIVAALCGRGHTVHALFDPRWSKHEGGLGAVREYKKKFPQFSYEFSLRRTDRWSTLLFYTREILSYRRYLRVRQGRQSDYYKDRYEAYLPNFFRAFLRIPYAGNFLKTAFFGAMLKMAERIAPSDKNIIAAVRRFAPDFFLASPVDLRFASSELEYLKAAKALGIPSAVPVASWDNLTTKGLIHVFPDMLFVWNDVQKEEAVEHQDFPRERIRIIGAPMFDEWFSGMEPSISREEFCQRHGLRPEDAIIVYLGSSSNMAEDETWLVEKLRDALDNCSDELLQRTQMIVRPHPANAKIYEKIKRRNVVIVPKDGDLPDTTQALQLFFDTLYFSSAAVVGANTTGIIDAMVMGKPAIGILTGEYGKTQEQTKHFRQLLEADVLKLVRNTEKFPAAVHAILEGKDEHREKRQQFIKRYIRPRGVETPAGEAAAREVENMLRNC